MRRIIGIIWVAAASAALVLWPSATAFQRNLPQTWISVHTPAPRLGHPFVSRHICHAAESKGDILSPSSSLEKVNRAEDPSQADADADAPDAQDGSAATNTINERLMAELKEVTEQEERGPRSAVGKKLGLEAFRSEKTDEERAAAIEGARNLNGVNPVVALTGGVFALAAAGALWTLTNFVAEYFAMHPIQSDVYFVERVTSVFRNIVMGMVALASGFFGVTGLGILLLGIRVAYGVTTGELDPTPIKRSPQETQQMPNVWDLMLNKKPGRRGGKDGSDNFFGI